MAKNKGMRDVSKIKDQLMDKPDGMSRGAAAVEGQREKRGEEDEKYIRDIGFLSRTAIGFLELSTEDDIYEFIARQLKDLVGDSVIIVNSFEEATDSICCRAVLGLDGKTEVILSILGRHPTGMVLKIDHEARLGLTTGKLVKVPGGFYEFTFRRMPRTVCRAIEKLLDIGDIYAMGFAWKGNLFGNASIVTKKRTELADLSVIETFIYQASVALQRRQAERALREAYDELETRVEERTRELAESNEKLHAEVTQRKLVEKELKESKEKISTILENTKDVIFQLSPLGKIVYVSPKSVELYGYKPRDLIGRHLKKTTPISELPKALKALKSVLSGETISNFEINQIDANGNIIPVEINATPVRKGGKIVAVEGIMRDITERKRAEETLQESEEKLRLTFDSVSEGITVTDLEGNIVQANAATARMHGYDNKEGLIGQNAFSFIAEGDHARVMENLKKTLEKGASGTIEYTLLKKDGSEFPAELSASLMRDTSGNAVGFVAVIKDITERKKMEEQLIVTDRLASIGELASGIAHELNNPLTSVIGFSNLLLDKDVPNDVKEDLKVINREAQRTAQVVRNLLTFARKHPEEKHSVDINKVIQRVLELRAYEQRVNNIEVNARFATDLPDIIANNFELQQVFINIIINAEHFMTEAHGRSTLTITTEWVGDIIKTSIADDGPGITKENLGHLFDPFFTTKEVGKGTGLGLSICHGIITAHGGRISAKSELGKGATFVVELPVSRQ